MKNLLTTKVGWATALAMELATSTPAPATLLVYEPFDYHSGTPAGPTNNGFELNGQSGGTGFAAGSAWYAYTNTAGYPITVYAEGSLSGSTYTDTPTTPHQFAGTVANLPTSGGYFGFNGFFELSPQWVEFNDHMEVSRPLDPGVTASFADGSTTWVSFVSVRARQSNNPAGLKFALGKGPLLEDRGYNASGEAIGGGGGIGYQGRNMHKVYPQFWDNVPGSAGETSGSFINYDVCGRDGNAHTLSAPYVASGYTLPAGETEGPQSMIMAGSNNTCNIIVAKIEWRANGTPDVISLVRFTKTDTLSEAAFNAIIAAQPPLCSANWPGPQPDLDQAKFDTLSLAGSKAFGDEIRIATTFEEVVGSTPVVETPFTLAVTRNAAQLAFTWKTQPGKRYNLRCSPDLSTPPAAWTLVQGNIAPDASDWINELSIPQPAEPNMFYVVEESPAPAANLLAESFDGEVTGWSSGVDAGADTAWQLGTPSNVGPPAANTQPNCYGTNLNANYGLNAIVWLRSPVLDLTGYSSATLQFNEFKDIEGIPYDFGSIRILAADNGALLATLEGAVTGNATAWASYAKALPFEAFAEPIRIEFRFKSDDWDTARHYAGWYIDDVVVQAAGS